MPKKTVNNLPLPEVKKKRKKSFLQKISKSLKRKTKRISLQTKSLFLIGFLLVIIPIFFYVNEGVQLAFFTPKVIAVKSTYPLPTKIMIPAVGINLPITETAINHGVWQVADDAISHLTISARPGEIGTIILYGHNTNDRFGPIRWLSVGQTIVMQTKDSKTHTYKIVETKDVAPSDVSVLLPTNQEKLILYTCDGFADLQRFIVVAVPR